MEKLLEKIDGIKQKISDQEYLDIMNSLSEARNVNKVSLYNVKLLVCYPEKGNYRKMSIQSNIEQRLVMMPRDKIKEIDIGQGVSLKDNKLYTHSLWVQKAVEMELDNDEDVLELEYVKYRFLGAETVEAEMEEVDINSYFTSRGGVGRTYNNHTSDEDSILDQ